MTTVLLIEKDSPAVNLMEWALRQEGFEVIVATDPDAADGIALNPDVIVFNTHMPGDGKRLWVSTLRFLVPGVAVIDLVPANDPAHDTGADAYLQQPYRIDNLIDIITKLGGNTTPKESQAS